GNAGQDFNYLNNTFQFTLDKAIKVRGTPRERAFVYNNIFAKKDIGDAVGPTGNSKVIIARDNKTGIDDYGNYGVCDFDGDRRDDLFLATGTTWWYSSAGKREWTFLSAHTEKLHQIGLGDFDGDRRCDVF